MKIVLIVAVSKGNLGIGKDNDLLWHLPADMKFFKDSTFGYPVITGRKNYESIPERYRPLQGRENIIITRDNTYKAEGAIVCNSIDNALNEVQKIGKEKCFVIGGGQIYEQFLASNIVDEIFISWVDTTINADTFFKGFNANNWTGKTILKKEKDAKNEFSFNIVKYTRKLAS